MSKEVLEELLETAEDGELSIKIYQKIVSEYSFFLKNFRPNQEFNGRAQWEHILTYKGKTYRAYSNQSISVKDF